MDGEDKDWVNNTFAGIVLLLAGSVGVLANLIGIYTVYKCRHLHNSFGFLCLSHCVANTGVCATFALWCAPTTILHISGLTGTLLGKHIGQVNILFWDACVYSHLSISLNRFICINFPVQTKKFFTRTVILIFIAVPWTLATMHVIPYFWSAECYVYYDPIEWVWVFADTECGVYISTYFDFYTGLVVFGLLLCLDMGTLLRLRKIHNSASVFTDMRDHSHKRKQETRFFIQSLCQSAIFGIELMCFYFIVGFTETKWEEFMSSTFVWVACHAADGLILDLFHAKRAFKAKNRDTTASVVMHTMHEIPALHHAHVGEHTF